MTDSYTKPCRRCREEFTVPNRYNARVFCDTCLPIHRSAVGAKRADVGMNPAQVDRYLQQASAREWRIVPPWELHPQEDGR